MRKRLDGVPHAKGINSLPLKLGAQVSSDASSIKKYQMQRVQWKKHGKIGKDPGMAAVKSHKQKRIDRWRKQGIRQKSSFCIIDGSLSSEEFGVGPSIWQIQRSSCTPRWFCWRRFRVIRNIYWKRINQHHRWQLQKSWISSPDCQVAMDKQQTQYPLIPRSKWKMLPNYWKFQNRNVETFGFVYHDINGPNHGPVWKTQSFLLKGICTVIFW